jgi:beta-lactamase class D
LVKDIIIIDESNHYRLSGKTGSGILNDNYYIMWMVGYIEKDHHTYFFALNYETDDWAGTNRVRYDLTYDILVKMNLINKK